MVRLACVSLFLELFLWHDHSKSQELIRQMSASAAIHTNEAERIVFDIREVLIAGSIDRPDAITEKARTRAFEILAAILNSSQQGFTGLQRTHEGVPFANWPLLDQEKARSLAQLADTISTQLYFASGAFSEKPNVSQAESQPLSEGQKRRFLREAAPLFDLLSQNPHPSTAHHLLETFGFLLPVDPRTVFLRIATIVKAGRAGGYQYESLAVGLIVNIVETVFADFRPMLQQHEDCRTAMIGLLDVFVEAGWPQAIQLTYRLDDIFR